MSYKKEQIISGSYCGADAELSMVGAFAIVQDSVTELMGSLHIDGVTAQREYGAMWVFSSNRISYKKRAYWGEHVFAESHISGTSLVRLFVETVITNVNHEVVLTAKTEVCGIDVSTKKIRKVETIGVTSNMIENIESNGVELKRLNDSPTNLSASEIVKSSNIDYCHHTNNVEYIRFVTNTYSIKEIYERKFKEFQINYINQSFEGEKLDIYKDRQGNRDLVEIKCNGNTIVKCELVFEN